MDNGQDELMNDLLAQLDSRDETVQSESANVLNEMQLNQQANEIETSGKQSAKSRFQARQVMKAQSLNIPVLLSSIGSKNCGSCTDIFSR